MAEKGILKGGYTSGYTIMNTVGDDVGQWFRQTMLDSVVEGIPVDHYNPKVDSLKSRLIEGGRIKPLFIKSKTGTIIHRSVKQRAQAIARIESTRIINRTHDALAEETLGDEAVFRNSNPQDSRSTFICEHASRQKAMTLEAWDNTTYGRPPRLSPFHLCRSVLIAGRPEWFEGVPEAQLQGAGLAKTAAPMAPSKTAKAVKAAQTAATANVALRQAAAQAVAEVADVVTSTKKAAIASDIAGILGSEQGIFLQQTKLDSLLSEFEVIAPAAEWAAKKALAVQVLKKAKGGVLKKKIDAVVPGAAKESIDDIIGSNIIGTGHPKQLTSLSDFPLPAEHPTLGPLLKQYHDEGFDVDVLEGRGKQWDAAIAQESGVHRESFMASGSKRQPGL